MANVFVSCEGLHTYALTHPHRLPQIYTRHDFSVAVDTQRPPQRISPYNAHTNALSCSTFISFFQFYFYSSWIIKCLPLHYCALNYVRKKWITHECVIWWFYLTACNSYFSFVCHYPHTAHRTSIQPFNIHSTGWFRFDLLFFCTRRPNIQFCFWHFYWLLRVLEGYIIVTPTEIHHMRLYRWIHYLIVLPCLV